MDDPDAPSGTFTHWIVFDMNPRMVDIGEDHAPEEARQGKNDYGQAEYGGPQPPSGEHRYFFRVYALDKRLDLPRGSERAEIERAMQGHIVGQAELMGRHAAEREMAAH
jgi:Raf kinase inhibitor-like YbhB/YbcL family protein